MLFEAVKVWAKSFGIASYNALFLDSLNLRNSKRTSQKHCRVDASGGILLSRQCAMEAREASRTLFGCIIFHGVSVIILAVFSVQVFSGPKESDGQSEGSRSFCIHRINLSLADSKTFSGVRNQKTG